MNRSDHWQNLAWLGELLHTPGSVLTLPTVYHPCRQNAPSKFAAPLRAGSRRGLQATTAHALTTGLPGPV